MEDYDAHERAAVDAVKVALALPLPEERDGKHVGTFDPWSIFPSVYGSFDSEFDRMAVEVLTEILTVQRKRYDLAAEMFREMLCSADLCDYGSSPRVCFATEQFKPLLPALIEKWKAYSLIVWEDDIFAGPAPSEPANLDQTSFGQMLHHLTEIDRIVSSESLTEESIARQVRNVMRTTGRTLIDVAAKAMADAANPADEIHKMLVLDYARARGCTWIMLDSDGPVVDGLAAYEW